MSPIPSIINASVLVAESEKKLKPLNWTWLCVEGEKEERERVYESAKEEKSLCLMLDPKTLPARWMRGQRSVSAGHVEHTDGRTRQFKRGKALTLVSNLWVEAEPCSCFIFTVKSFLTTLPSRTRRHS